MDWDAAIERNRQALMRVLAGLVAMAGLAGAGLAFCPRAGRWPGPDATDGRATLPRQLYRAVLRLLRPAESAARRLVIVAARGIVHIPSPPAPSQVRRLGRRRATTAQPRPPCLPLFDTLPRWGRRRQLLPACLPRISVPGLTALSPLRQPPGPFDERDTTRLAMRIAALRAALDDLPKHARRFARWEARRDAARGMGDGPRGQTTRQASPVRRVWPLRPGRPPGRHSPGDRRPAHEVHDILTVVHGLAIEALARPDTS